MRVLTPTTRLSLILGALLVMPGIAVAQGKAQAEQQLSLVEAEVRSLDSMVSQLRSEVGGGSLSRSARVVDERVSEARYAYGTGDFEACALNYESLLSAGDLDNDPRKGEADWFLGECLYLDENLVPALTQFRRIVDSGPNHPFFQSSALRLIELLGKTGRDAEFETYYSRFAKLAQGTGTRAMVARYQMGKARYRQGRYDEALELFAGFGDGAANAMQARYFAGVVLVAQGQQLIEAGDHEAGAERYRRAMTAFTEVMAMPAASLDLRTVRDLARLDAARLYYELGDIPQAVDYYADIDRNSPVFADAMYENIWAHIELAAQSAKQVEVDDTNAALLYKQEKYQEALRILEIFQLAFPEDTRVPALRLLQGHVRVRMERYDEAMTEYETAADDFKVVRDQLDAVVQSAADPMVYFDQLVDDSRYSAEADLTVPTAALRRAREDDKAAKAVEVASDLYEQQDAIADGQRLIGLLEEALYGEDSVGLLETYRAHRARLASAQNMGLLARTNLAEIEMDLLSDALPAGAARELKRVRSQLDLATGDAVGVVTTQSDALQKKDVLELQARAIETRLHNLEMEIDSQEKVLGSVEEYLTTARQEGRRTAAEETEIRGEVQQERAQIVQRRAKVDELRQRLEPGVLTAGLSFESSNTDTDERRAAVDGMTQLENKLAELRRSASGSRDLFGRLDAARSKLLELERVSASARDDLNDAEGREVADIKAEVERQKQQLALLKGQGRDIGEGNRQVSGRIGQEAFDRVAAYYADLVTRADMGSIDVLWFRKEEASHRRTSLVRERHARLKELEQQFKTVLEDVQ